MGEFMGNTSKRKLTDKQKETIRAQVLRIRATGKVNMFEFNSVHRMAYENGMYELVCFMADNPSAYSHLIFTGNFE